MKLIAALFCIIFAFNAFADDITVVAVRKNIPLSDDEPSFTDYYLTGTDGLKKNLVVNVVRKTTIRDPGAQSLGDIDAPVGQLKVIAVSGKLAVAREYKLIDHDDVPMIEQPGIMTGDRVDTKGSFIDEKTFAHKRKVAEAAAAAKATATVAATPAAAPAVPVATPAPVPAQAATALKTEIAPKAEVAAAQPATGQGPAPASITTEQQKLVAEPPAVIKSPIPEKPIAGTEVATAAKPQ